jgi:hypothetical protein
MTYKFYVRGHGGEEAQMQPPSQDKAISMITVGQMGCTMSDQVADNIIFGHKNTAWIDENINNATLIYWTKAQRDEYYEHGDLHYSKPVRTITNYDSIYLNLAVDGADDIGGKCGLCYWNEAQGKLIWIKELANKETLLLSEILEILVHMLGQDDSIELYWTACMSAAYWSGNNKKVSFNPTK